VNVGSVDRILYSIFQKFNLEWKTAPSTCVHKQLDITAMSSAFTPPPPACYPHYCHQDKSKPEQECTRLVLAREQKKSVIDQYQTHATDTGSPEVQIAIISERIGQLTDHFKTHQKDHGSRRGLLMLVSKRRRLLDYLKRYDSERYKTVIGKLGIRK